MILGDLIKEYRREHGYSMDQFAKMSGLSKAYISILERNVNPVNNKPVIPSLETIKAVAQAINMDFNDVIAVLDGNQPVSLKNEPEIPPGFEPMPKMKKVPLIGAIACGEPITAEQNIEKMVDVPEYIRCDFSLTCHGDSMVDAGIHDKDVVYIRIQPEVENGEIAAVRIDGEATLKRVYYNPDTLTLMPANPAYAPMVYTGSQLEEVHIEGKAVGWTHWVG